MTSSNVSRRVFLNRMGAGTLGLAAGAFVRPLIAGESTNRVTKLTEHLFVYHSHINIGIVRAGDKALLIDCGNASVMNVLPDLGINSVDRIIFTHHHRDQACGAHLFAAHGARISVPAAERDYFDKVSVYWNDPKHRWGLYSLHPHHLMLAESVRVDATLAGGDLLNWGPAKIRVLATPGHTDGSVSYLVEVDGKKVIFSGDVIYDHGRLWEIYSLQKGCKLSNRKISDYHGFMGSRKELIDSLSRIKQAGPDTLIPSHGHVMTDPSKAIDDLVRCLEACYDKYVSISALRHYFPEMFADYAGRKHHMPGRIPKTPPECLRHYGNTWVIVSEDKTAFVLDCGNGGILKNISKLLDQGEIRAVEGLWVTHYHNDHVNAIPEFQKTFDCPCITDRAVAQVVTNPLAWRLPCISPSIVRVDRITKNGESWQWREFKMTAYNFPGQTLYHSALLVEAPPLRMFFVGDSFSPFGIDDYCSSNRNWLGRGVGFDKCIALVEKLKPTHIFNNHISQAFDFTPENCRFMRDNLAQREKLYGRLFPWDHPNYGMDEPWVRCYPCEQHAEAGTGGELRVVVTNHSNKQHTVTCRAVLPRSWNKPAKSPGNTANSDHLRATKWIGADVPPKSQGQLAVSLSIPQHAKTGRYVIPIDLKYGPWNLPQFTEAVITI